MAASIFHRITGGALSVVGLAVLTWWLAALAGGSETYASFTKVATSIPGKIVLIGLTWAFLQHLFSASATSSLIRAKGSSSASTRRLRC